MIFPKAKKIAKELDWHKTKKSVFGLYKNYFFNVGDGSFLSYPQHKFVFATTGILTEEQKLQIKTALETNKKLLKFSNFEIDEYWVFVQFSETLNYTKIETVYALFDFLVDLFQKLGVPEQNKCHDCGSTDNIKYSNLNDIGILLCSPCFSKIENSYNEVERKRKSEEKNYFTGFLGSLVFSIPGIIAWVLIAIYLESFFSAMAMVIAFLGIEGYDYFKGPQSKWTKYIIIISNIISIIIANVITKIVELLKSGLTLEQSVEVLQTNEVLQDLLYRHTLMSLFLASFVWIYLLFLLVDNKNFVRLATKIKE